MRARADFPGEISDLSAVTELPHRVHDGSVPVFRVAGGCHVRLDGREGDMRFILDQDARLTIPPGVDGAGVLAHGNSHVSSMSTAHIYLADDASAFVGGFSTVHGENQRVTATLTDNARASGSFAHLTLGDHASAECRIIKELSILRGFVRARADVIHRLCVDTGPGAATVRAFGIGSVAARGTASIEAKSCLGEIKAEGDIGITALTLSPALSPVHLDGGAKLWVCPDHQGRPHPVYPLPDVITTRYEAITSLGTTRSQGDLDFAGAAVNDWRPKLNRKAIHPTGGLKDADTCLTPPEAQCHSLVWPSRIVELRCPEPGESVTLYPDPYSGEPVVGSSAWVSWATPHHWVKPNGEPEDENVPLRAFRDSMRGSEGEPDAVL